MLEAGAGLRASPQLPPICFPPPPSWFGHSPLFFSSPPPHSPPPYLSPQGFVLRTTCPGMGGDFVATFRAELDDDAPYTAAWVEGLMHNQWDPNYFT